MVPHDSSSFMMITTPTGPGVTTTGTTNGEPTSSSSWSWEQDKLFETALATFSEETTDRWEKIATRVPGKTAADVEKHYQILLHDVMAIEAGLVELPDFPDLVESTPNSIEFEAGAAGAGAKSKTGETERKRGTPWTEEEHRLFLMGLQKYGKGDWRSISRNAVISRTPTQVASHAQKYFNRMKSDRKEKKRSSIHDIVLPENENAPAPPGPALLTSAPPFAPNSQSNIAPSNHLLQQTAFRLQQTSFPNHGGPLGYQNYAFPM